jgi:copper chaperone
MKMHALALSLAMVAILGFTAACNQTQSQQDTPGNITMDNASEATGAELASHTTTAAEPAADKPETDGLDEVVYTVQGMTCGSCENTIQTKVGALDGVEVVKASHTGGTVTVAYNGSAVDSAAITKVIEDSGYSVNAEKPVTKTIPDACLECDGTCDDICDPATCDLVAEDNVVTPDKEKGGATDDDAAKDEEAAACATDDSDCATCASGSMKAKAGECPEGCERVQFIVNGITCPGTAGYITRELEAVPGIAACYADPATQQVTVDFDPEATSEENVRAKFDALEGFEIATTDA